MFAIPILLFLLQVFLFGAFCCIAAGLYAFAAWLIYRRSLATRAFEIPAAVWRSPIFVFYMLACASGFLTFGPSNLQHPLTNETETLPNGYVLTVPFERPGGLMSGPTRPLGWSRIERIESPSQHTINGYARSLEVDGAIVIGAYNWHYDNPPQNDQANQGYFKFDTAHGTVVDFPNDEELTHAIGHKLHLIESEAFHHPDVQKKRLLLIQTMIAVGLPAAFALVNVLLLVRVFIRHRQHSRAAKI